MSAFSNYLENKVLDHVLGKASYTAPSTLFIALYTVAPSDTGGGTEVSGSAYARQSVTFGIASNGTSSSNADVLFPVATGNWGNITHLGVFDSATAGNLLWYAPLSVAKSIGADDQLKIASGNFSITLD